MRNRLSENPRPLALATVLPLCLGQVRLPGRIAWTFLALLAVAALVVLAASPPAYAAAGRDTVRVGFFLSEGYGYEDADGDYRGYDVHLAKAIAMYGGFDVEMVGYDNVPDMEEALLGGEVDALIDFLRTGERERDFIFTDNPILEEQLSLYALDGSGAAVDGRGGLGALRIGHVSDAGFLDYFLDYCAEQGAAPQLEPFRDVAEMHAAMEWGDVDACLTGSAVPAECQVLLSMPPLSSYIMLRPGDAALRRRMDLAISELKTTDPNYISELYRRYVPSRAAGMSPLSARERDYLSEHPVISVAVVRGAEPFVVEGTDGSMGGVISDYYRALGEELGVEFRFVAYKETQEAVDAVANGDADILGHYYGDVIIAERDGLYDTAEYGTTECARLARSGFEGQVGTAAVTNRTAYLVREQMGTEVRLETYPNIDACFQALMGGEVDAVIGSMTAVAWLVNQHTMRGASLTILPNVSLGVRGAVPRDNTALLFALNKAIAVSGDAWDEVVIEDAVNGKADLHTVLENLPAVYIMAAVAVLLVLIIALVVSLVLLARSGKARMALLKREVDVDGLTGAGSRRYGADLLGGELRAFPGNGGGPMVAMLDVDHFKEQNDVYGHEYGDHVLRKIVEVLRGTLRESDEIIRWGGDEFVLVCPRVRGNGAERVLEKVVAAVSSADFQMNGKGGRITVSVGASFFLPGDNDVSTLLRRCDKALYEAKGTRNSYRICVDKDASEKP